MIEIMKFDDALYMEEGIRREQLDKAVALYGLDKKGAADQLEGLVEEGEEEEKEGEEGELRASGKQIMLQ